MLNNKIAPLIKSHYEIIARQKGTYMQFGSEFTRNANSAMRK